LSVDYDQRLSPEKCLHNTIQATRPGSIIVFHDSYKADRNLSFALPRFIDYFSEKGFVFKAL
jgi:peptidoglycan-N-acetylglucosamine deacetylase